MAIQIINCPSCGTFLMEDTAECHSCGHVLDAGRTAITQHRSLPTDAAVDEDMEACPTCGETCRQGLVRCWNCGAFMRPEIEAEYRRRQELNPVGMEESFEMEVLDSSSVTESDSMTRRHLATPESLLAAPPIALEDDSEGDDFELSEDVHMSEADDDAFDLAETIHLRGADSAGADSNEPSYRLQPSSEEMPASPTTPPADGEMDTIPLMSTPASAEEGHATAPLPSLEAPSSESPAAPQAKPEEELLKIAAAEEAEIARVRKAQRSQSTFVVFCPEGHRIRVREKFRGKTGRCPKCQSVFVVPQKVHPNPKKKTDPEMAAVGTGGTTAASGSGRYARWLTDIRLHTVVPEKLKLKADSLLNDFQSVDVGLSPDELLIVTLVASAGLFGGNLKKKPAIRTAMLEHFANPAASPDEAKVGAKRLLAKDAFSQLAVAQPAPLETESLFGNIPVFGAGRIAVRLPKSPDDKHAQYLSFCLSEFRAFADALRAVCGIEGFGANTEVPLTDHYETYKCHYSEAPVLDLTGIPYYQKDPSQKIEISGWKCAGCGLIVSEEARKKEKIGGLNGKGIAKAKCPKCSQKFGSNALVQLAAAPAPAAPTPEPAEA